jgi:hypothetical protein
MAKHALLSASSAHRWLNCTPSARLTEHLPDTTSVYAEEGTLAHALADLELSYQLKEITKNTYNRKLKAIKKHELYTEDMSDYVEIYTGYVLESLAYAQSHTSDALIFLEQKLDFSKWVPEGFGTGDCTIIADDLMEVIDFKYGKGVEVSAASNPQMMLYALGALEVFGWIYDIQTISMTIVQPRLDNISTWGISVKQLLEWADTELKEKARAAWEGTGECFAGDWCKFCKVKARCKARADAMLAIADQYNREDPNLMSVEEIAEILHSAEEIQAWAKDIQAYALDQARDHGVKFPGWKMVEGRSNRKIEDEAALTERLLAEGYTEDQIYKPKTLEGITTLEKVVGKKRFALLSDGLIIKPPGRPTLVTEDDRRPEINSAEADFDL